jgi:hypothetical protein
MQLGGPVVHGQASWWGGGLRRGLALLQCDEGRSGVVGQWRVVRQGDRATPGNRARGRIVAAWGAGPAEAGARDGQCGEP